LPLGKPPNFIRSAPTFLVSPVLAWLWFLLTPSTSRTKRLGVSDLRVFHPILCVVVLFSFRRLTGSQMLLNFAPFSRFFHAGLPLFLVVSPQPHRTFFLGLSSTVRLLRGIMGMGTSPNMFPHFPTIVCHRQSLWFDFRQLPRFTFYLPAHHPNPVIFSLGRRFLAPQCFPPTPLALNAPCPRLVFYHPNPFSPATGGQIPPGRFSPRFQVVPWHSVVLIKNFNRISFFSSFLFFFVICRFYPVLPRDHVLVNAFSLHPNRGSGATLDWHRFCDWIFTFLP